MCTAASSVVVGEVRDRGVVVVAAARRVRVARAAVEAQAHLPVPLRLPADAEAESVDELVAQRKVWILDRGVALADAPLAYPAQAEHGLHTVGPARPEHGSMHEQVA